MVERSSSIRGESIGSANTWKIDVLVRTGLLQFSSSSTGSSGGGMTLLAGPPNRDSPPSRRPVEDAVDVIVRSVIPGVT